MSTDIIGRLRGRSQQGFGLVSAIFMVVVLAALGAAMASLSTIQHTSAAMDVLQVRAHHAARAGLEWGLYQALVVQPSTCPVETHLTSAAPTLNGFVVTVKCANTIATNTDPQVQVRQLESTACNIPYNGACPGLRGSTDYVERVMKITFGGPAIYRREGLY
jgi:MSHA biogenesis protein MshP